MSWSFDLLILAGVLGAGGSYITVKSNLERLSPQLAGSFFDYNPYQVRNMISMRHEAIAGTIWLGLSLVVMSTGTIVSSIDPPHLQIMDYLVHTFLIIGFGFLAAWLTLTITHAISRRVYIPRMIECHSDLFDRCTRDVRKPEMQEQLHRDLDQIGTLIDVPRRDNEDDSSYLDRLRPFFTADRESKVDDTMAVLQ